jgi:Glycosyl transferase family 2
MSAGETVRICLTPVRNEETFLPRFLAAASLWADHIVVADQGSTDRSREIAGAHPKVTLVENPSESYDEAGRQRLLLRVARELTDARRLLVALDADEVLSADVAESEQWAWAADEAPPGTALRWHWANLLPGGARSFPSPDPIVFGLVDDGREHAGLAIHSRRLPVADDARLVDFRDSAVLHLQYLDWERMESKQRWYQAWELLNVDGKRPIQLYRQYHRMHGVPASEIRDVPARWVEGYDALGLFAVDEQPAYHWDRDVARWIAEHGAARFSKLELWDVDWRARAAAFGDEVDAATVADPRSPFEKRVHAWLRRTQERSASPRVRWLQRALRPLGW